MTKNIEMRTGTVIVKCAGCRGKAESSAKKLMKNTFDFLCALPDRAARAKREISDVIVEASEILADRTARKGLFGEDSGLGYCGTDVDYIPEGAIELKYINYDMTGFDNACARRASSTAHCTPKPRDSGVLKCFNGF